MCKLCHTVIVGNSNDGVVKRGLSSDLDFKAFWKLIDGLGVVGADLVSGSEHGLSHIRELAVLFRLRGDEVSGLFVLAEPDK